MHNLQATEKKFYTIGYGNTEYLDGTKVKKGDKISEIKAIDLFLDIVSEFS